jgi:subtilisin family serine protease
MTARHVVAAALAALVLLPPRTLPADADHELVVALTRDRAVPPVERLERLGLRSHGSLAACLAAAGTPPLATADVDGFDPSRLWLLEATDSAAAAAALDSLRADAAVAWAEPNRVRGIAAFAAPSWWPDDPLLGDGRQWALHNPGPDGPAGGLAGADVRALEAWSCCTGANALRLAVADTGVDPAHPDLGGTLPDGSPRFVAGVNVTGLEAADQLADSVGHGTPVAGVLGARTNDGPHFDSLGIAGVCGGDGAGNVGCRIVPIKIAPQHSTSATSYAIAAAIAHATAVGARAMNLSFAGAWPSRVERLALQYAITHGCVVVAAAGNHGYSAAQARMYPAAYAADGLCIQVGASDARDERTAWSGYGPDMDLVAPGLGIWSTFLTYPTAAGVSYPGYAALSGTSFAAPFVTGAVGLLAVARPELDDTDFRHVLRESAHDIGPPGVDSTTGWGRLDLAAALAAVRPGVGIWHDEVAATSFRPLGRDTLEVDEGGFGSLDRWLGRHPAERIEATAVVALPDSFLDPVRVWPRVGGTTTVRGDWSLPCYIPHAEVREWPGPGTSLPAGTRRFTLRGYLYRILEDTDAPASADADVPLPPEQTRFGFTVLGPVDRPPRVAVTSPPAGTALAPGDTLPVRWSAEDPDEVSAVEVTLAPAAGPTFLLARVDDATRSATVVVPAAVPAGPALLRVTAYDRHGPRHDEAATTVGVVLHAPPRPLAGGRLDAAPNPFHDLVRLRGPAGARVEVVDLAGRRRRAVVLGADGGGTWDGRDGSGSPLAPGIYFLRTPGVRSRRLVRLE